MPRTATLRNLAATALLCLLAGCGLWPAAPSLPALEPLAEQPVEAQQQWHLHYRGQQHYFGALLETRHDGFSLVLLDSLGRRVVTLESEQGQRQLRESQRHAASRLWPHLGDALQLAYAPLASLQAAPPPWRVEAREGERQLWFSAILVASVRYHDSDPWHGTLTYENNRERFGLVIESRRLSPGGP